MSEFTTSAATQPIMGSSGRIAVYDLVPISLMANNVSFSQAKARLVASSCNRRNMRS